MYFDFDFLQLDNFVWWKILSMYENIWVEDIRKDGIFGNPSEENVKQVLYIPAT